MTNQWQQISEMINNKLSAIFERLDFKLIENQVDTEQVKMRYEYTTANIQSSIQINCNPLSDMSDPNRREFLWLKIDVTSGRAKTSLKVLSGNAFGKNEYQKTGWVFVEVADLDEIMDEIAQVANDKLLNWVKKPVTASIPTLRVDPSTRIQALQSRMSTLQDQLNSAIKIKDIDKIKQLQSHINNLERMLEKTLSEMEEGSGS